MASFPGTTMAFKSNCSVDLSNSDAVLILLHINQPHYKLMMLIFFLFFFFFTSVVSSVHQHLILGTFLNLISL